VLTAEAVRLWLPALTLGLFALGTLASAVAWARGKAPLAGVTALFALGLTRQVALLFESELAHTLADAALLGMACAGVVALRAVRRTTRERNRAEDLHWDAMETVRALTELGSNTSSERDSKLERVLALGASRFGLELAWAWRSDGEAGRLLLRHDANGREQAELPPPPVEELELAARSDRPLLLVGEKPSPTRVFFGAPVQRAGRTLGSLGFSGAREPRSRFAATDKDLLNLMAQWLAIELEREESTQTPAPPDEEPTADAPADEPAPRRRVRRLRARKPESQRGGDLNAAVQRSEAKLRRRIGADGRLELALAEYLPRTRPGRVSLPALVEALVVHASRLAPSGSIRVETALAGDVTLAVQVEGEGIDADALARVSSTDDAAGPEGGSPLRLDRLERLLRLGGGGLSVSLEPPRRAVLTAFLPPLAREAGDAPGPRAPQSSR
jgi:hypothetical protein